MQITEENIEVMESYIKNRIEQIRATPEMHTDSRLAELRTLENLVDIFFTPEEKMEAQEIPAEDHEITATVRPAGKKFLYEVDLYKDTYTRNSAKSTYSHVVVVKEKYEDDSRWGVYSFHSALKQAESKASSLAKGSKKWENDPMDVQIIEIKQKGDQ